jgi:hypothetical protein
MHSLCSWVLLGTLLLGGCIVGSHADYEAWEVSKVDKICYAGTSSPPTSISFSDAANEQSEIEEGDGGLGEVQLEGNNYAWSLRQGCESGTVKNETGFPSGLPIRNQDNCGACWAYAHADFISLWHCQKNNTHDMTQMSQVASLQQHGNSPSSPVIL